MNKKGIALIIVYLLIVVLTILGSALVSQNISEIRIAQRERDAVRAFHIAEAGLEQAFFDLKQDFISDASWRDSNINGYAVGPDYSDFYSFYGAGAISFGNGSYIVELKNVSGKDDEIWVKSTGSYSSVTAKVLQVYVRSLDISPWDDVIFCGSGASGGAISGNVLIHGSMHILGTGILPTETAISLTGSASIGNNYQGIPVELSSRIPALPTVDFGGEMVQSLGAEIRVKNGRVDLSGSAQAGSANITGNSVKETVDALYINVGPYDGDDDAGTYYDGFGGNKGAGNVYSDNGTTNAYDMGDAFIFPSYTAVAAELETTGYYSISEDSIGTINSSTPDFSYTGAGGSISWDQSEGELTINGIIKVTDGVDADSDANISLSNKDFTVEYQGQGTIVSDNVEVHGDLLSESTFPTTDRLGFIAANNVDLATGTGDSQLKIIAAFYAGNQITSAKQNEIAGAFASNYFDMGSNVPKIYQVPSLRDYLPPGLDFSDTSYVIITSNWQELEP